ncbi:permease-like cell division protein FtsX [Patescibacteria group bacterium]|nr:permease-like cell division protein FtsX [Patescibacteria group bacterium]
MRYTKTTWRNIRRSPYQAFAAILIMTLTFLAISFFGFLLYGSSAVINFFESRPQVTAFFKSETKQTDINALENSLQSTGKISSIKYVSKEEALRIYRQQNQNDPLLLDLVTADILPASLEISTIKIEDLNTVSETLKTSPAIQEVVFQKDVIATLTSWTNVIRKIGIALIFVLSLVSVFIIITITGIKISQKKEDIEIMTLIGATRWHIRWPFVFEGIFYGVTGAVIGWVLSSSVLLYSTPFLSDFMRGIPVFPIPILFYFSLLGGELLLAIILGAFSSFLAVLRYLK